MKRKRKKGKLMAAFFFLILLSSLIFVVSVNTIYIINKNKEKAQLKKMLSKLEEQENILKKDIIKMQDPDYVAKYAREKYFYSKPNEIILRME